MMEPVSVSNSLLPLLWAAKFGSHLSSNMQQHWPSSASMPHDSGREEAVKSPRSESVPSAEAKSGASGRGFADVLHRLNSSGNGNFFPSFPHLPPFSIILPGLYGFRV